MSAVPDNILPWESGWDTMSPELPTTSLNDGVPDTAVDVPRSNGITVSGVLGSVQSTADSLLGIFGKVYSLQSSVENAKFQQTLNTAKLDIQKAQAFGTLDIQKATVDANVSIAKAQAQRATNDALARVGSGSAGFVQQSTGLSPKMLFVGAILLGGLWIWKGQN